MAHLRGLHPALSLSTAYAYAASQWFQKVSEALSSCAPCAREHASCPLVCFRKLKQMYLILLQAMATGCVGYTSLVSHPTHGHCCRPSGQAGPLQMELSTSYTTGLLGASSSSLRSSFSCSKSSSLLWQGGSMVIGRQQSLVMPVRMMRSNGWIEDASPLACLGKVMVQAGVFNR